MEKKSGSSSSDDEIVTDIYIDLNIAKKNARLLTSNLAHQQATSSFAADTIISAATAGASSSSSSNMNNLRPRYENGEEVVTVNGHTGVLLNKQEIESFRGPIPLSEYPISDHPDWIIKKKTCETPHQSTQEVTVKYLEPPPLPPPGEIIIQQEEPFIPPMAPPIIIRTPQPIPPAPEPLIIREAPPKLPQRIERKIIKILAPKVPPPPRKVIVQKPPPIPEKAQPIIIERWLAPKVQPRRVIFQGAQTTNVRHPEVRNEIHECDMPRVVVNQKFTDLGVHRMDPNDYWARYGNKLYEWKDLPDIARNLRPPPGLMLASDITGNHWIPPLEGDLQWLERIDLHREGLSEYINIVRGGGGAGSSAFSSGGGQRRSPVGIISSGGPGGYYESRATSSPPRGSVIRTIVDSTYPAAATTTTTSTSVYKSTMYSDNNNPPGNGGGYML